MKNITKHQIYRNINEQIQYLYDSKKIIVDVEDRHYLEERNYISLVKPYKAFFSTGRNNKGKLVYKKESNFKDVIRLVNLDDEYAKRLYELVGVFERKLKSILFTEICHNYITCENSDIYCIRYIDEIKQFISGNSSELPLFCKNTSQKTKSTTLNKAAGVFDGEGREKFYGARLSFNSGFTVIHICDGKLYRICQFANFTTYSDAVKELESKCRYSGIKSLCNVYTDGVFEYVCLDEKFSIQRSLW